MFFYFFGALFLFLFLLIQYTYLSLVGLNYKLKNQHSAVQTYPSVDVLIPAYNEGMVIKDTLEAMVRLHYPGSLKIYVLNDGSQDETGKIAAHYERMYQNVYHICVPAGHPKGKSRVLNYGLSVSHGEYFVVYDGDNQPEANAVKNLVEGVLNEVGAVGAVGTVRTLNAQHNLLTRMIAIEFQVFQLILQAGRWKANRIGSLPGTNMLLKRSVVEALGGYDVYALAGDAELTIRITASNQAIVVVPQAVTWEQEPETLHALIRQRTRWVEGNIYLMFKFFRKREWWTKKCLHHLFYYLSVYIFFPLVLLLSNIAFFFGVFGVFQLDFPFPFFVIWFVAYFVYTMQLILAQWYDETLDLKSIFISFIMYFTYAQLFVWVLINGFSGYLHTRRTKQTKWVKTNRVPNKKSYQSCKK